jgi:Flp pilus assembly protein TadB
MYIQPKPFLSRLLGAAWSVLVIAVVLWLAVQLLADVWVWLVGIIALTGLVRLGFWARRFRRDEW